MNSVIRRLGEKRVNNICFRHGLGAEDTRIVIEIFDAWETLIGRPMEKTMVGVRKTAGNPKATEILNTILEISLEFSSNVPN